MRGFAAYKKVGGAFIAQNRMSDWAKRNNSGRTTTPTTLSDKQAPPPRRRRNWPRSLRVGHSSAWLAGCQITEFKEAYETDNSQ